MALAREHSLGAFLQLPVKSVEGLRAEQVQTPNQGILFLRDFILSCPYYQECEIKPQH